jgi:hypothetical protein
MKFSFSWRTFFEISLAFLTLAHMRLLSAYWPIVQSIDGASLPASLEYYLSRLTFGFVVGASIACIWQLAVQRRFLCLGWVLLIWVAGIATISRLPIARASPFALDTGVLVGVLVGAGLGFMRFSGESDEEREKPNRLSWFLLFLAAINVFLFLAPYSQTVPSGVQEPGGFSAGALTLESKDSVGIKNNLVFLIAQHIVTLVVDNSILSSSLTSILICAFGIACFATGIRVISGNVVAIIAAAFMLSDGWVLTAAYAGNLTVTLIASAGALFLVLAWALTSRHSKADFYRIALGLLFASFLGLYSYAAVRMPWILSLGIIYCVIGSRLTLRFGLYKTVALIVALGTPVVALMVLILVGGYGGDTTALSKDLLVSWPSTSVLEHPTANDLSKYKLIHNPDVPIWKQVARPTNGDNFSYIWLRTPSEMLTALSAHISAILREHPKFFFLQTAQFFLIMMAFASLPFMRIATQRLTVVLALWCLIWISSFLLVPDAVAYRRGIAFSVVAAALASLGFLGQLRTRRSGFLASLVLAALYCACRLPHQLIFSSESDTRSRMFTVCSSSFAVRSLLSNPQIDSIAQMPLKVSLAGLENEREANCIAHATRTREWRRLLPASELHSEERFDQFLNGLSLSGNEAGIVYCSVSSNRFPSLALVCAGKHPDVRTLQVVPVVYGGVANSWVLFERR